MGSKARTLLLTNIYFSSQTMDFSSHVNETISLYGILEQPFVISVNLAMLGLTYLR